MLVSIALVALPLAAPPQDAPTYEFDELGLTVTAVGLEEITHQPQSGEQLKARWRAVVGDVKIEMSLFALGRDKFGFVEPDDVTELVGSHNELEYTDSTLLEGEQFGWVPYAAFARAPRRRDTQVVGMFLCLAGLTEEIGYALEMNCTPVPSEDELAIIERFFAEGVSAAVETVRVTEWTEEEVEERWRRDVPEKLWDELDRVLRTDHYIILTNSSGSKAFAKKMEEFYDDVKEVYPFEEVANRRLMPVFLFRDREDYAAFMSHVTGNTVEEALRSAGHAWRDYYATTYEAPGDPTHVHEATHQIFANRLRLNGGGSWFQEGVAEYISSSPRERKNWARRAIKKDTYKPFNEFFVVKSMLYSAAEQDVKGGSESRDNYTQAASVVEFLRDGKWKKDRFQDYIHAVGSVPRGDLVAIEAAILSVYEVDIEGLQEQWIAYWKKK